MEAHSSILVVDDEYNLRRILEAKLRLSNFAVMVASDAATALRHLLRHSFALVLLDVHLPDANAITILPRLRAAAPDTPFLLMTAYEEEGLRERALRAGAVEILYKPFDLDLMVQTIRFHIAQSRHRSAAQPGPLSSIVQLGQAVVLEIPTNAETREHAARITAKRAETFDVVSETAPQPLPGRPVGIRVPGEDGLYQFRTHVVTATQEQGGTLCLAKPSFIRRRQRRKQPRVPLSVPVTLHIQRPAPHADSTIPQGALPLDEALEGITRDVSLSGMAIILSRPLPSGTRVRLSWTLPLSPPSPGDVQASGEVVRSETTDSSPPLTIYHAAVRFVRLSAESRARLRAYLDVSRPI